MICLWYFYEMLDHVTQHFVEYRGCVSTKVHATWSCAVTWLRDSSLYKPFLCTDVSTAMDSKYDSFSNKHLITTIHVGETGSSCYNFHIFKHIMQTKRARLIIFFHKTRLIPLLIKISESFEIQANILEILRNKQGQKIVTTYPKVGVSCYSTWGKLLHLIRYYFIVSLTQPNMI